VNLAVTNCILTTNCNAFKLGTESGGDFRTSHTVIQAVTHAFSRQNDLLI